MKIFNCFSFIEENNTNALEEYIPLETTLDKTYYMDIFPFDILVAILKLSKGVDSNFNCYKLVCKSWYTVCNFIDTSKSVIYGSLANARILAGAFLNKVVLSSLTLSHIHGTALYPSSKLCFPHLAHLSLSFIYEPLEEHYAHLDKFFERHLI